MAEQIGIPEQPKISPEQQNNQEQKESAQVEVQPQPKEKAQAKPLASPVVSTQPKQDLPKGKPQKSETLERIEDIMEDDLEDVYKNLPPSVKQEFRKKGEEAAVEIEGMMHNVKLKSKQVFKLLFGWMKIIPGVNRYFLKQEAKIKTDEIMHVKEELDKASHGQIDS